LAVNANTGTAYVIWIDERWAPGVAWDIYSARGVLRQGVEEGGEERSTETGIRLEAVYPNPMLERASVRFVVRADMVICLAVYNVAGQKVCTLREGVIEEGVYDVRWDGRDQSGKEVRSGIYFVGLEWQELQRQDSQRLVQKLVKLQ
jgi:hypothetical protein